MIPYYPIQISLSTQKDNFFYPGGTPGDLRRALPGSRGFYEQLFGLAHPAGGGGGGAGEDPGKIRGTPRCAQRVMTPNPNNCAQSRRSRSCNPESRWYNNPNNLSTYPRSPSWRPRSPIPNPEYPEYFPLAGGSPTPPRDPAILLGFRYLLLLGFVRLLWEFLLV